MLKKIKWSVNGSENKYFHTHFDFPLNHILISRKFTKLCFEIQIKESIFSVEISFRLWRDLYRCYSFFILFYCSFFSHKLFPNIGVWSVDECPDLCESNWSMSLRSLLSVTCPPASHWSALFYRTIKMKDIAVSNSIYI